MKTNVTKTNLAVIVFGIIGFFASPSAKGEGGLVGLFVEPALTYELGSTSINYPAPFSNSTGSAQGFGLGARLGIHLAEIFFVGLDARYSMPTFKDSSVAYEAKSVSTNWGPVVGAQMPIVGLRVWGSYILGSELNPEKSGTFDIKFQSGTGYRVGAGMRVTLVSLNLEYQQIRYGQAGLEQIGPFSSDSTFSNVNLESKTWIASVSFPLEL